MQPRGRVLEPGLRPLDGRERAARRLGELRPLRARVDRLESKRLIGHRGHDLAVRTRAALEGDVVVVSPHLDDAAMSLGAAISRTARAGGRVTILTVLAGNPDSDEPAGEWDRSSGFATAGEASRARREEDALACERLGARPVWLPFGDEQYERGAADDEIRAAVVEAAGTSLVLLPGFPLSHDDHRWLHDLLSERLRAGPGRPLRGAALRSVRRPSAARPAGPGWEPGSATGGASWPRTAHTPPSTSRSAGSSGPCCATSCARAASRRSCPSRARAPRARPCRRRAPRSWRSSRATPRSPGAGLTYRCSTPPPSSA